ncbi:DUF3606 domain-containing protein [Pigmentiphaga aceris]|uniref:DUF3606 domain-containing protein n=1 Tax=Pigmentiphaga aceris TaxID=1940612 RepID=A0A5C0AVI8_9BURK|nr:DUF3606 domain-containing protein [Pigmentiphaga aceris]QEI06439.1 DUF3606 domain-containing protein [Pigmentiphaga aceris]
MRAQSDFPPTEQCPPIDLSKQYELRYWSNRLGVSQDALRAAVEAVGTHPVDVTKYLSNIEQTCVCPVGQDPDASMR